jgi:hypothetical protein
VARLEHWSRYLYPELFLLGLLVIVWHGWRDDEALGRR